jgi:hypothetical protein
MVILAFCDALGSINDLIKPARDGLEDPVFYLEPEGAVASADSIARLLERLHLGETFICPMLKRLGITHSIFCAYASSTSPVELD